MRIVAWIPSRLGLLLVLALTTLAIFALAAPLALAGTGPASGSPGFLDGLSIQSVATLIGIVLPLIVAVVTHYTASNATKGVTLAILAAVGAIIAVLTGTNAPDTVTLNTILGAGLPVFVTSVATYFGLYRSLDIDRNVVPDFGLGRQGPVPART